MKLIVFPGGNDPHTVCKDVYKLLEDEAIKRGFTEFILKSYPSTILLPERIEGLGHAVTVSN